MTRDIPDSRSCLEKQALIAEAFAGCTSAEERYHKIIELGQLLPPLAERYKIPESLVKGCQSQLYLRSWMKQGRVHFEADSDALISRGLAALLVRTYSGETPETILRCPPDFLEKLGIASSLTPNRANGLYSLHLRMKQDALNYLVQGNL